LATEKLIRSTETSLQKDPLSAKNYRNISQEESKTALIKNIISRNHISLVKLKEPTTMRNRNYRRIPKLPQVGGVYSSTRNPILHQETSNSSVNSKKSGFNMTGPVKNHYRLDEFSPDVTYKKKLVPVPQYHPVGRPPEGFGNRKRILGGQINY
jgi:hypothetical protein